MGAVFAMDPEPTRAGLAGTGAARSAGLAAGVPALPVDEYLASFSAAAGAAVAAVHAEVFGQVERGVVTSAVSVNACEGTEDCENAPLLSM